MAGRAKRCKNCREPLQEVLVYKNGLRRRTRVVQCPNHCDLKCPHCDSDVRVTVSYSSEKKLKCRSCDWRGHSPDREFNRVRQYVKERISLQKIEAAEQKKREASEAKKAWHEAVKKAKRAAQRAEILKNIDVDQLGVGSECPFCGRNLRIVKTVRRTSRFEFVETTKKLTCGDAQCDSTFLEVTVMTPSEDFGSVASVCHSCTQPIRDGSFCGCS